MITARTAHGSGGHSSMDSAIAATPEPLPNIFDEVTFVAPSMTMAAAVVFGIMLWHIRGNWISRNFKKRYLKTETLRLRTESSQRAEVSYMQQVAVEACNPD
ncbi:hypothetical protein V8E51_011837 [Hyaloscypha variabilis]